MYKMENYNNQSANSTVLIFGDNASPIFVGFSMVISGWIIVLNSFVILSLLKDNKRQINNTFTFQLLTLSLSDVLVGLATLPVYATVFKSGFIYEDCLCRFVLLLSAHAVEQFHIFGICVNRVSVVYQLTTPRKMSRKKVLVMAYLLLNWIIFLTIYSVAFRIWGRYRHKLSICSLNEMFQDDYKTYVKYTVSFYIVPSVLINLVYGALILKIRCTARNQVLRVLKTNQADENHDATNNKNPRPSQSRSQDDSSSDGIHTRVTANMKNTRDTVKTGEFRGKIIKLLHVARAGTTEDVTITREHIPLETLVLHDDATDAECQPEKTNDQIHFKARAGDHVDEHWRDTANKPIFMSHRRALTTMGNYIFFTFLTYPSFC